MSNESSFLHSPHTQYDLVGSPEPPPSTNIHDNVHQLNEYQPDANYSSAYRGPNYAGYGHWAQYRENPYHYNPWYEGPPPPAVNSEGQYTYQTNSNIGYPPPGLAQYTLAAPDPSRREYYIPPAHRDLPNDGVKDRLPLMPDAADAFSRNSPESAPSGMSAMEGLKRLANRYLNDPCSQVDTLRMGPGPSSGRLRVVIMLDIDI
ncbi:hypothetical protein BJY52DRAFT_1224466 [Lactarius psammicola]|nr:hypothetical protein BJY52DRAFT_1224466 [Lactarius psammicola]